MKRKYTEEEKELAISLWRESGLSRSKWCEQEGINRKTFTHWLKKEEQVKVSSFVPMQIESKESEVATFQISYPNGIVLNCPASTSVAKLIQLLGLNV